jgi:hypothetical protein
MVVVGTAAVTVEATAVVGMGVEAAAAATEAVAWVRVAVVMEVARVMADDSEEGCAVVGAATEGAASALY